MGRPKIDKTDWVCCVCGEKYGENTTSFKKIRGSVYCPKHASQIERHGKTLPKEKERNRVGECCVCGEKGRCTWIDGKDYCRKHYLQMTRHGKILEHTIFDRNEYIDHPEDGYCECIMVNKNFEEVGRTLIDLDKKETVEKYKVYMRMSSNKKYAMISLPGGQKILLHRFLCGFKDSNYTLDRCVDHINGNSLDNRCENLRVCHHEDNMKNIKRGKKHICGVVWLRENEKWSSRITSKYKTVHLGNFDEFEEAVYARIKAEKEFCEEYGSNSEYFYVLDADNPLEEIKKIGFEKPVMLDREVPLMQKKHVRKDTLASKVLTEIKQNT